MNHILVITTEPLPVPGGLTTGAGLRAWGLAEGLRSRGFPVTLATPQEGEQAQTQSTNPTDNRVRYFNRETLADLIENEKPDIIVMQHWGLVYALPQLDCPLVIDLAGPHLLERRYWGNPDPEHDLAEKIAALRRADFITCGGFFQRHYFYPYLAMAGYDVRNDQFPVIPFSVSPVPIQGSPSADAEPTFIYGGAFLAWQNPETSIRVLLDEMEKAETGRLLFYGGTHPSIDASGGRFLDLYEYLKSHPRVEMRGWKPFASLVREYANEGHVALDLMERNPERELAYTTRTMVYLQCGLPVIYNNYSELSDLITENDCGWCLDPDDETGFRNLVKTILGNPETALSKRDAAQTTATKQSWDKSITPLADYCENPTRRKHEPHPVESCPPAAKITISSQKQSFFARPGIFMGIIVYFPVWILSHYLDYRLRIKSSTRAQK